jgi:hypothetical protein
MAPVSCGRTVSTVQQPIEGSLNDQQTLADSDGREVAAPSGFVCLITPNPQELSSLFHIVRLPRNIFDPHV